MSCLGSNVISHRLPLLLSLVVALFFAIDTHGQSSSTEDAGAAPPSMLAAIQEMLAEDPTRADSWRLLGRIHRKENRPQEALHCLQRAVELQANNAAAHFDLGELLRQLGDTATASQHDDRVMQLAPSSSYARQLVERGLRPPPIETAEAPILDAGEEAMVADALALLGQNPAADAAEISAASDVDTVAYEMQTFDGEYDLDRRLNQLRSENAQNALRLFIEMGSLYNSNISLTPVSRELAAAEAASFQAFLSPDVEWSAWQHGPWRAGPLSRGYYTINEDNHRSLNLSSFQPGAFLERDLFRGDNTWIGRVDYVYSLDLLDGHRFADRHALTTSATMILPDADVIYAYVTGSISEFADDGTDPSVDSLDGPAIVAGISRFFQTTWTRLPSWSLGTTLETADTEGDDFRYHAITGYANATIALTPCVSFLPSAGLGFRDYGEFTGAVNRDEVTWRLNGRLRWRCSPLLSFSLVVGHNRFASDNEEFDTERTEAGIVATVVR